MEIERLLQLAIDHGASDLHLSGGNPPALRVDGAMRALDLAPLAAAEIGRLLATVLDEPQRSAYADQLEIDVAITHASGTRFRLNGFTNRAGPAAALRTIPAGGALARAARRAARPAAHRQPQPRPGPGDRADRQRQVDHARRADRPHQRHREPPHPDDRGSDRVRARSKRSLINQREIGRDTRSFARALRSALRADPDVILVGELRDSETIALALTAAETGHLVLASLHTSSAAKTIDRLIDAVPSADKPMVRTMLSSSLQAVIAQTLLRRADGEGRVAAYEILIGTTAVANLIRENQIAQLTSMMQTGSRYGMQLMRDAVLALVASRRIERAEAERALHALTDEPPADQLPGAGRPAAGAAGAPGFGFGGLA